MLADQRPRRADRPSAYEIKHDGYRFMCRRDGERVRVFSRRGNDYTDRVPLIAEALKAFRVKSLTIDGKALVIVDLTEIEHKPLPVRSPPGHLSVTETLQVNIELLQSELAKVEAAAAGHRADFERDRADKLLSEVLRATVDLIGAKEATARTEGDLAVVRARAEGEIAAVHAHVERLETELAAVRARRHWWHRLTA